MTARIFRSFEFQAGVHFAGSFYVNSYSIDTTFNVESESITEQNIALERIKYYLSECLEHSVIVHEDDEDVIEKYLDAGLKVCTIPEQPYDQVVGIMLMLKLNSITEDRLVITDILLVADTHCVPSQTSNCVVVVLNLIVPVVAGLGRADVLP